MERHNEPELRIIEVKGALPSQEVLRPASPARRCSPPTPAEALEGLRSMKGAASVIERLPALQHIATWTEVAFWGVNETKGTAIDLFLWDCDFANWEFSVGFAYLNAVVMFWGAENLQAEGNGIRPPQSLTGQVWGDLNVPTNGHYLFAADVGANGEPPDYMATVEFCLDDSSLGQRQLFASAPQGQYFLLELKAGKHRFIIRQASGAFHFRSLSTWQIPVSPVPPNPTSVD